MCADEVNPEMTPEDFHSEGRAGKNGLASRLMEIARETAPLMNDGRTSKELMDDLYDDITGMPK